ncbi:MAG: hypothetical protein LUF35_03500 [Lachnospiraceae bacterium]|nr:hypothetical protein [Lachnospiraceae bacterium]
MRKRTRISRILAMVLTLSLVFQQAGITTLADDGTVAASEWETEAVTESATEAETQAAAADGDDVQETSAQDEPAETQAAGETVGGGAWG